MPAFAVASDGSKLSAVPRTADPHKRDRIAQAVVIKLPESFRVDKIEEVEDGKVQASLAGSNPHILIGGNKTSLKLDLHANGYLYMSEDGTDGLSLKARLDLRVPDKNAADDSELQKLMQRIESVNAEKRSAATAEIGFAGNPQDVKRRKIDATAHRRGLFGAQASSRSAAGSPNMPPSNHLLLPSINVTAEDPIKRAKQDAIRTSLVHLVAVRDVSKDYIVRTLKCSLPEVEPLLNRHCAPGLNPTKYKLNQKAFKLLDPYSFNYTDDDRKMVIDKTVEAFDRMRLGPEEKEWQKLLPKDQRGQGICLSKLEKQKVAVLQRKDEEKEARSLPDGQRTMVPKDAWVAQGMAPPPGSHSGSRPSTPGSRPGSSGSIHSRPGSKSKKKAPVNDWSGLMEQKKQDQAKLAADRRTKNPQKNNAKRGPSGTAAPASQSRAASQAKSNVKKPTERKSAASTQPPASKIKSSEFITESDEEEAEAATKVGGVSPRPTQSQPKKTAVKETTRPAVPTVNKSASAATGSSKTVGNQISRAKTHPDSQSTNSPVIKVTTASATSSSSLSRPAHRPSALDKSKLTAKSAVTPSASSRPATPTSANMPLTFAPKVLQTRKVMTPAPTSNSNPRAAPGRAVGSSSVKVTSKDTVKPAANVPSKSAKVADKPQASSTASSRDVGRKPAPKRDPNMPPKRYEPEKQVESSKRALNGEVKAKSVVAKNPASSIRPDKAAASAHPKASTSKPSAKPSETLRAPPMQKTASHQRKSSSPIKPSPLASSPPISASDIDEQRPVQPSATTTPLKRPASTVAQRPVIKAPKREGQTIQPAARSSGDTERPPKRKVNEVDSSSTTHGAASSGAFERPAKRRETGAPASRSTGASGSGTSKLASANGLKARPDNDRADSHSPSPASSTIGSTSTKGTSTSILYGNNGNTDKGIGKQPAKEGDKDAERIFGLDRPDLEKLATFDEDSAKYNAKLKDFMALPTQPDEMITEMADWYARLERQRRVIDAIKASAL